MVKISIVQNLRKINPWHFREEKVEKEDVFGKSLNGNYFITWAFLDLWKCKSYVNLKQKR